MRPLSRFFNFCSLLVGTLRRVAAQRVSGQTMVELALVMYTFMLMAVGVFEFGRGFHANLTIIHAARDGARVAMDPAMNNDAKITDTVNKAAAPLVPSGIVITRPAGRVRVRVTYNFDSVVPLINTVWGGGTLTIGHTAVSRVT